MLGFSGNDSVPFALSPNATCENVFTIAEPALMKILCDLTTNDTQRPSMLFNTLCCTKQLEVADNTDHSIQQYFEKMCYSNNVTDEFRRNFCEIIPFVPAEPFAISLISYILLSLLTPLGILANLLIVFTVLKCKKLKTTTGYFISNLAIADLFCILGMIVYLIARSQMDVQRNFTALLIFSSIDVSIGSASLLNVTAASVERAIAVAKPMVYPLILRKERAKKVIGLIWLYCLMLFTACCLRVVIKSSTYSSIIFYFAVSFSFFIPCILVLISYINISVKALNNLQMEKRIQRSMIAVAMLNEHKYQQHQQRKTSRSHPQARELKLALNLTVMTVPFVFGWGYFMVGNIYEEVTHTPLTGINNWFLNMLPYLISCLNPVTYLLFTKTLRKEAIKLLAKPFRKFTSLHNRRFSTNSLLLTVSRNSRTSESSETRIV